MANALFTNYKQQLLGSGNHTLPDWDAHDIRPILVDEGTDTPVPGTDEDLADILAGARINALTNPGDITVGVSITAGAVDVPDWTHTSISGNSVESIVLYYHTGTESTSPLIIYYDTATGLPVTPNGGDINVAVNGSGLYGF